MNRAIVVDFDGTFVEKNSFEEFYKFLVTWALRHLDLLLIIFLFWQFLLRKLRKISHGELKRRVLVRMNGSPNTLQIVSEFEERLSEYVNKSVLEVVNDYVRKHYVAVLSSAAPEMYVLPFMRRYQDIFRHVIATPTPLSPFDETWVENIGGAKANRTMASLKDWGLNLAVLITDSSDDLPLLCINKEENWLVCPSVKSEREIASVGAKVMILRNR